ncbi:MAG: glycosyltransferase [Sedimentisphaerales bacterium]|nr:glycosyltransferase [Sedimentisphaerales bacterium]
MINSLDAAAKGEFEAFVVAMRSENDLKYSNPVKFEVRQNVKNDYICAADYLNFSHIDVVCVQHEFGLFGGEGGSYINLLLNKLKAPVITTLHTILDSPDPAYYRSLVDVCEASQTVITMNKRGIDMLRDIYHVSGKKVRLIPHGIPDLPFVDSSYYKHKFGMEGRRTILTFGLLDKNKGIEVMLKAMPKIIEADPSVLYIILGMTHPAVLKQEGESYRFKLQRMVKELGCSEHVVFHNRFVKDEELHNFLCAADIYVTPYLNEQRLTSGTLSFAVGTGKAVVSTPYWAALELLDEGRGKIVPFNNSKQMTELIVHILEDDPLFYSLRRKAYDYGRLRTWPKNGQVYWKLLSSKRLPVRLKPAAVSVPGTLSNLEVPEPSLIHLKRLTDDTGLIQHATFTSPNRKHGYCTDDNARAAIAMIKYYAQYADPDALRFLDTYLSFILYSQSEEGNVRNFMRYDRTWLDDEPANDALGRLLWAFGTVIAKPPTPAYLSIAKDAFDKSAVHVEKQFPRGTAYSILGMCDYLKQFPGASDIKRQLEIAADELVTQYRENNLPDWQWFEDILTYDNAILPCALFASYLTVKKQKYLNIAQKTCEFFLENTFNGSHFSFIGCKGWYERKGVRAVFDQQPIEVASTVMMLRAAFDATGNHKFLTLQRKAFDWFLGENDLHIPVYDFRTRGCNDGLTPTGLNTNQGAESTISFLLSLLNLAESYAIIEKTKPTAETQRKRTSAKTVSVLLERPAQQTVHQKQSVKIKELSSKENISKNRPKGASKTVVDR